MSELKLRNDMGTVWCVLPDECAVCGEPTPDVFAAIETWRCARCHFNSVVLTSATPEQIKVLESRRRETMA